MQDEFKTTVISFDKSSGKKEEPEVEKTAQVNVNDPADENVIRNVLFNVTTKVPHVTTSIPAVDVEVKEETKKAKFKKIEDINEHGKYLPKFYVKEYRRYFKILIMWIIITLACCGLESWALASIILNENINNWVALTLIPGLVLSFAFLIVYANNYLNYRNEARNVDFSKEKVITTNVTKLYKRLKTGYININWFCLLTYVAGLLVIGIDYLIAGAMHGHWGDLSASVHGSNTFLVILIVSIIAIFVAFFAHIFLLVGNYLRASKIDSFYAVQIVSDEELMAIKKHKNKRNCIIFIAVIICIALIGILIYKIVNSKKNTNNVTINN